MLTSITIPTRVTSIGAIAFGGPATDGVDYAPCKTTGSTAKLYVPASMAVSVYSGIKYSDRKSVV